LLGLELTVRSEQVELVRSLVRLYTERREESYAMTLHTRILSILLSLALLIGAGVACRPEEGKDVPPVEPATPTPERAQPSPTPSPLPRTDVPIRPRTVAPPAPGRATPPPAVTALPPSGQDPVDLARADLAQRLGVELDRITVVHVQADEFPASNLGCPGKEVKPIPAIVSGIEIVLAEGERHYVYHARRHTIVYCGLQP
jgi:hypothetical protein